MLRPVFDHEIEGGGSPDTSHLMLRGFPSLTVTDPYKKYNSNSDIYSFNC